MTMALLGSWGLFSMLQAALKHSSLHLHATIHNFLDNFCWLANNLVTHPTHVHKLQPHTYIGSCNASGTGTGSIWFPPDMTAPAILWRAAFPKAIQCALVSVANPTGTITNSDLELLGTIAHQAVLASQTPMAETTLALLNDNMAAIHWLQWGLVTSTKATTYLLHVQALHAQHHCYTMTYNYLPGPQHDGRQLLPPLAPVRY